MREVRGRIPTLKQIKDNNLTTDNNKKITTDNNPYYPSFYRITTDKKLKITKDNN